MAILIKGYLKTSLIEWPSQISAVVFLPKCNFRCSFCHNSDLVLRSESLETVTEESILQDLKERKSWIDGVAVTGGEPTLQPELPSFFEKIQVLGIKTMLETNGTNPKMLENLLRNKLISYLSMDLKGPLDKRYSRIAGVSVKLTNIKTSMNLIRDSGLPYEFRTTVVPGILSKDDLHDLAEAIGWARKWFLQQFVPHNTLDPELIKCQPYSKKEMEEMEKELKKLVKTVRLRGV